MKMFLSRALKMFVPNEAGLQIKSASSAKSIRIMLWIRIILKVSLILFGLYLIEKFTEFVKFFIFN